MGPMASRTKGSFVARRKRSAGHESRERGLYKPPQLVEWLDEYEDLGIIDVERI
jgi:hypothetical protein